MEILTEFDELQEAMSKINLNESIMPYVNGILCQAPESYNKVQKILDCPEMISAHKYLYDLDLDQLDEDDMDKIDKLYKLGVDRGFIVDDLTDWDAELAKDDNAGQCCNGTDPNCPTCQGNPENVPTASKNTLFKAKVPCWTVIYSAVSKDGDIKTGEAYSNAISASAAKADVKSKLSNIGYSNISILAIESCEADVEIDSFKSNETEEVEENDMLRNKPHNAHIDDPAGVKVNEEDEEDDSSEDDSSEDDSDDSSEDDSSEDDSKDSSDDSEDADSDEDSSEDSSDDSSDDSEDADSDEDSKDEDSKDDDSEDDNADDSDDDSEDEDSKDDDSDDDSEDEDSKDDDSDEDDELDANEKAELKNDYTKVFKNTLSKCKFNVSFNDLTLEQKVKFFTELSKAWTKEEPNKFMTDKQIEQLNNVVVKTEE